MPAAAVVAGIGAAVGVVSSIKSADAQKSAAESAAKAAKYTAKQATQLQHDIYQQNREDLAPWREAGTNALESIQNALKDGSAYKKSPGYDFRLAEGSKAINRSAAAGGGALSGKTLKALNQYGQDYATNDYQNYLNRYYNLAGLGQVGVTGSVSNGNNYANNYSNTMNNLGNSLQNAAYNKGAAQAGAYINSANAITNSINSGYNNYLMWQYANS